MKGLVLTHIGLEEISAEEIQKLISAKNIQTAPGRIIFECKAKKDLATLCYHGRTFSKVVLLLHSFTMKEIPSSEILDHAKEFFDKTATVECIRIGEHDFTSADVENSLMAGFAKFNVEINRRRQQTICFLLIDNKDCFFGIDFSGTDLGRRDYRIFLGRDALKGNIAASLLFIADYKPAQTLLDPFCRHGIIPIEAALLSINNSPHKFGKEKFAFNNLPNVDFELKDNIKDFKGTIIAMDDNFKHVSASKKNAKIAGVIKSVDFSRTDLKWLDAKFGKNFLDHIITLPPQLGRVLDEKKIDKIYNEFFNQAEFILKKSGKLCLVMKRGIDILKTKAKEFNFQLEKELNVLQGKEELTLLLFSKAL